jgi:flagellar basal-body rod modification protein FlgD
MTQGITSVSHTNFGQSAQQANSSEVSRDEFLKLLTMQLKAQNPLKPYDNQEFASQLAQFSQLEQLSDIRSLLDEQVQTNSILTQTISNTALPGMLGKSAKAFTDKVHFDGESAVNLGYSLPTSASEGSITIYDSNGTAVKNIDLESLDLTSGEHMISWDGRNNQGDECDEGDYSFVINATDASGNISGVQTFTKGEIETVRFKNEGTVLVINGMEIPLENITDITTS